MEHECLVLEYGLRRLLENDGILHHNLLTPQNPIHQNENGPDEKLEIHEYEIANLRSRTHYKP